MAEKARCPGWAIGQRQAADDDDGVCLGVVCLTHDKATRVKDLATVAIGGGQLECNKQPAVS